MEVEAILLALQNQDPMTILIFIIVMMFINSSSDGVDADNETKSHKDNADKREQALDALAAASMRSCTAGSAAIQSEVGSSTPRRSIACSVFHAS